LRSSPSFALDANALIHALRGSGRVRERLALTDPARVAIPSIVAYEIEYGTLKSTSPDVRRRELHRLLSVVEVLPFDSAAAQRSATIRLALEKRGQTIGHLDLLIAGTALACGYTLVTHNTAEFSRVPGLQIEDWY
jgi:tRNA(fMet)-specific endonuclease VapC